MGQAIDLLDKFHIEIRQKGDWKANWHLIVPFWFFIVGIFNKKKKEDFYNRYFTTLGRTIYVPDIDYFYKNIDSYEAIIYHEHQHMIDIDGWPARISYIISKEKRLWFEKRGYFWNIYIDVKKYGKARASTINNVIEQLSGPMYNNMTSRENASLIVHKMIIDAKKRNFPK